MRRALVAAAVAACSGPRAPASVPAAGLAISVYSGPDRTQAVIDDRRVIDVAAERSTIWLDRIDAAAALSTLVIEPLGGRALAFDQCARPRLGDGVISPLVACAVRGPPGRHLVRVHYVTASFPRIDAQHEIAVTADRATIATRYTLVTPAWGVRAELALFDGLPGGTDAPRALASSRAALDGGTAILHVPPRTVPARLVRVFRGDAPEPFPARNQSTRDDVRVMLELDDPQLRPAPAYVRVADGPDRGELATAYTATGGAAPRIPLWGDPLLRGTRHIVVDAGSRGAAVTRVITSIKNAGDAPREVWIEEELPRARYRRIARPSGRFARAPIGRRHPKLPALAGDIARAVVVVAPRETVVLDYTVEYRK